MSEMDACQPCFIIPQPQRGHESNELSFKYRNMTLLQVNKTLMERLSAFPDAQTVLCTLS